ncbi:MAG: ankyrin repeat domain-containing protein [Thermoguttaceae bacterium]|nr:ankyrin repeat domain-containing protein [Thermoguttaceae bacterium]
MKPHFALLAFLLLITPVFAGGGSFYRASDSRLFRYIRQGNLEAVQRFVEANPDILDTDGREALEAALEAGQLKIFKYFEEEGVELKSDDSDSESLLWLACSIEITSEGKARKIDEEAVLEIVKYLVSKDFSLKESHDSQTLLDCSVQAGNLSLTQYLIDQKLDVNAHFEDSPIIGDLLDSDPETLEVAELLLKSGAKTVQMSKDSEFCEWSLIHEAIRQGKIEWVKLLVKYGASLETVYDGGQPLHAAVAAKEEEIVHFLVEQGAPLEAKTDYGWTPLLLAILDDLEMVEYLADHGANLKAVTYNDRDALFLAAEIGNPEIVDFLLEKKLDPKRVNFSGQSILFAAAKGGNQEIFDKIFKFDSDVTQMDSQGHTLLFAAVCGLNQAIIEKLLDAGVPVNAKAKGGYTAMNLDRQIGGFNLEFLDSHGGKEADLRMEELVTNSKDSTIGILGSHSVGNFMGTLGRPGNRGQRIPAGMGGFM